MNDGRQERMDRMDRREMTDADVEARLEAYAAARLSPDPDWSADARSQLVALAERQAETSRRRSLELTRRHEVEERRSLLGIFRRRAVAGLLAAALTVASVGAVFAADPASPLYGARVWLESITLGTAGVDQLDHRIQDAQQAAENGKGEAIAAALDAYRAALLDALKAAGDDPERLARLNAALGFHQVVLEELEKTAPDNAQGAIHAALKATNAAQTKGKPSR